MASVKREWPTYEEAKWLIQRRNIISREDYFRWHDSLKPQYLPKRPDRVYKDWITWSDFLNTNNVFGEIWHKNANAMPYWDAVRYIHQQNIPSCTEYFKRVRNKELIDVPQNPHTFYKEWTNWGDFLGKNINVKLDVANKEKPIWAIIHMKDEPPNVIWILKIKDITELNEKRKEGWNVLAQYWYEEATEQVVWDIVESTTAMQYEKEHRISSNLNQLLWELGNKLLIVRL